MERTYHMDGFKIGDQVKVKDYCSGCEPDHVYTLHRENKFGSIDLSAWDETTYGCGCSCQNNWILVAHKKQNLKNFKLKVYIK